MLNVFKDKSQSREDQVDELLSAYLDGVLTTHERAAVEAWLERDQDIRDRLEGMRLTVSALAGLPEVKVPRNFILAPSMVAPAKPAPQPVKRRRWPVFGWATAVATLLFLMVFAGDIFFATPAQRQPADIVAQIPLDRAGSADTPAVGEFSEQPAAEKAMMPEVAAAPTQAAWAVTLEAEEPRTVVESEEGAEAVPAAEVMAETAVIEAAPTQGTPVGGEGVGGEGEATPLAMLADTAAAPSEPGGGGGEAPPEDSDAQALKTEVSPTGEDQGNVMQGTPELLATPAPGEVAVEVEKEIVVTAEPLAMEAPSVASPMAEAEQVVRPTPLAVAIATAPATAPAPGVEQATEGTPAWLRLLEVGLGLAVAGLAVATLVTRRRESQRT